MIEALRALEKKWRGEAENLKSHVPAAGLLHCADELAALLTTRQEVAPVVALANALHAMGCEGVETWTDAKMIEEASRIVRESSPAKTSEARDAEVTDELVEMVAEEFHCWHDGSNLHDAISIALRKGLAAMRQEAGDA